MGTRQANFRLNKTVAGLLRSAAAKQKTNKTSVVEYCIGRYAAELGIDVEAATSVILEQIATNIAARARQCRQGHSDKTLDPADIAATQSSRKPIGEITGEEAPRQPSDTPRDKIVGIVKREVEKKNREKSDK